MHNFKLKKQSGLTLIEVLVSLVLGVIVLIGVSNAMLSMTLSSRLQTEKNNVEQTANIALDFIGQHMRNSMASTCERFSTINNDNKLVIHPLDSVGTTGLDGSTATTLINGHGFIVNLQDTNIGSIATTTDEIITFTTSSPVRILGQTNVEDPVINISGNNVFDERNILFAIGTCENMDVFTISDSSSGSTITPTSDVEFSVNYRELDTAMVAPVLVSRFYVQDGSLRQQEVSTTTAQEILLNNVEVMRVLFGVDAEGGDGVADRYITASQLAGLPNDQRPVTIELYMLASSDAQTDNLDIPEIVEITLPDTSQPITDSIPEEVLTFNDRILRRVFKKTIAIRNNVGI